MRPQIIIAILLLFLLSSCVSGNQIKGRYTHVFGGISGDEFRFWESQNKFEYFFWTEGGLREYTRGTWVQRGKNIYLNGFDSNDLNFLHVETNIEPVFNEFKDKVILEYKHDSLNTLIKADLIINGDIRIPIPGDTTYFMDMAVKTIQIQAYLETKGVLLAAQPLVDTLYSPEIKVADVNQRKVILLKTNVDTRDFHRMKLVDTLSVNNSRRIIWGKKVFKRVRD